MASKADETRSEYKTRHFIARTDSRHGPPTGPSTDLLLCFNRPQLAVTIRKRALTRWLDSPPGSSFPQHTAHSRAPGASTRSQPTGGQRSGWRVGVPSFPPREARGRLRGVSEGLPVLGGGRRRVHRREPHPARPMDDGPTLAAGSWQPAQCSHQHASQRPCRRSAPFG
jgi:hypothetical protein